MKTCGGVHLYEQSRVLLASALDGGECRLHAPAALTPMKGWVGPRVSPGAVDKSKPLILTGLELPPPHQPCSL
jgi:hypothetical protein